MLNKLQKLTHRTQEITMLPKMVVKDAHGVKSGMENGGPRHRTFMPLPVSIYHPPSTLVCSSTLKVFQSKF